MAERIEGTADVAIVGGGIAGVATAYLLARAGVSCTVIERDSVGSHASGFAYGGLTRAGAPGPLAPLLDEGWRIHKELADELPRESGVNTEFRLRPSLALAFTGDDERRMKAALASRPRDGAAGARWLDAAEARAIEPRLSPEVLGGVHVEGGADVEPYRLVLALSRAAEKLGATFRHGRVVGLRRDGASALRVVLERGEMRCERVVLATGPWAGEASSWLGLTVDVRPLKGQILRLQAPGRAYECSLGWAGNYAVTKPDGLLWAGTTEEHAGFDDRPTSDGAEQIMTALLKMVPALGEARLVQQTACLRPLSGDGLPLLGEVPGWQGVYLATGAGRQGIMLGPAMARVVVDLITTGATPFDIAAFDPGRFTSADEMSAAT